MLHLIYLPIFLLRFNPTKPKQLHTLVFNSMHFFLFFSCFVFNLMHFLLFAYLIKIVASTKPWSCGALHLPLTCCFGEQHIPITTKSTVKSKGVVIVASWPSRTIHRVSAVHSSGFSYGTTDEL